MAQATTNPKIEELRFRLKTDPKSRLFYQLAEELRKAGQYAEAEQVLRSGLSIYPAYLAAWVSLGRVLREQKNDVGAVEALTKAMQLDPGNVVAARLLADAYRNLGETLEAIKKYKLVLALMPGDEELKSTIEQLDRELHPPLPAPEPEPWTSAPAMTVDDAAPATGEAAPAPPPVALAAAEPEATAAAEAQTFAPEPEPGGEPEPQHAPALTLVPDPGPVAVPEREPEESPFDKTVPPFDEAIATGDVEPMLAAHDQSPFEEPVESATAAAVAIEQPVGVHVDRAPLAAEVPAPVLDEEADVFGPVVSDSQRQAEDLTNTLTMADLYVRQGLLHEARHIYENILARDPHDEAVRARLEAITPRVNPKIERLERWLSRVARKEVGSV